MGKLFYGTPGTGYTLYGVYDTKSDAKSVAKMLFNKDFKGNVYIREVAKDSFFVYVKD